MCKSGEQWHTAVTDCQGRRSSRRRRKRREKEDEEGKGGAERDREIVRWI